MSKFDSSTNKSSQFFSPAIVLISLGLIFGLVLCVFIPYGAGFDEEQHAIRIFDISGFHLFPNRPVSQGNYAPAELYSLAYYNQEFRLPAFYQFKDEFVSTKIDWQNMVDGITTATYFPLIYFPQAFVAGLVWRVFNLPIIPAIILMRIAGLLFYLFICYLTLRLLPIGKWIFVVLALTPTMIFQASTLSADGFTNAISFLFLGYILHLLLGTDRPISELDAWKLFAITLLMGTTKPGTIVLLPLLLILNHRNTETKKVLAICISGVIISVFISIGWTISFSSNSGHGLSNRVNGKTFSEQLVIVLNNLPDFIPMYLKGVILSTKTIYHNIVGEYSYWGNTFPFIYIIYPFIIIFSLFSESKNKKIQTNQRIFLFLLSFFCIVLIGSFVYIVVYIPNQQTYGSEGRYLVPYIPLMLISLAALFKTKHSFQRSASIITIILLCIINGIYLLGFYRVFYSSCLSLFSENNSCKLPIYQNVDPNNSTFVEIHSNSILDQSFIPQCDNIDEIELNVFPKSTDNNLIIRLSLLDKDNQLLRISDVHNSSINPEGQTPFSFSKVNVKSNEVYHFQLELIDSPSSTLNIKTMGPNVNYYKEGYLSIDNRKKDADDLLFHYSCVLK